MTIDAYAFGAASVPDAECIVGVGKLALYTRYTADSGVSSLVTLLTTAATANPASPAWTGACQYVR